MFFDILYSNIFVFFSFANPDSPNDFLTHLDIATPTLKFAALE